MQKRQQEQDLNYYNIIQLKNISLYIDNNQSHESYQFQSQVQLIKRSQKLQQSLQKQNNLRIDHNLPNYNKKQDQYNQQQYILKIQFDLHQLKTLTILNSNNIQLFQVYISDQYQIKINLILSNLFDIQKITYFLQFQSYLLKINKKIYQQPYVNVITQSNINIYVNKQNININVNKFINQLKHKCIFYFISDKPFNIKQNDYCSVIIGNNDNQWNFIIENLSISTYKNYQYLEFQSKDQKAIFQNLSIQNDYSYPLNASIQTRYPYSSSDQLKQLISTIMPYKAPEFTKQSSNQIYICHDMKRGYFQDINNFTPIKNNKRNHIYTYNYLQQTKIFNYFSHFPITIPPKMWRQLCKKYNVTCIGTFIIEQNSYKLNQDQYLTQSFALKLIYIAKKAQFDGYLINIEVKFIKNISLLLKWLQFLTKRINKQIPNSQIIWYDSIIINGKLQYQNQLNQKNKSFYQVTNGIFTNYWWNQNSLKKCLVNKIKNKSIYIGNDCFGRNTYAGGKYNLVQAVKKIQQIGKGQLQIALFAPGFTYQDNGETNRSNLRHNQLKMYHGFNIVNKNIEKWKIIQNGGNGWKIEGQWAITSYQVCKRQAYVSLKQYFNTNSNLKIVLSCYVAGTGPNFLDHYRISLQLFDIQHNLVFLEKIHPINFASQKQEYVQIQFQFDTSVILQNTCIKIIEQGKDCENWAGHYGTRFKNQKMSLLVLSKDKDWMKNIPLKSIQLSDVYNTYFNIGQNNFFHTFGQKFHYNYSSLKDFDLPPIFTLNNISNVQIAMDNAYIGGSCLRYSNIKKIALNKFKLQQILIKSQNQQIYQFQIISKGSKPLKIYLNQIVLQLKKQQQKQNGWQSYKTQMKFTIQMLKKLKFQFIIFVEFQKQNGLIGKFTIQKIKKYIKKQINKGILQMKLSKKIKHTLPYMIDITFSVQCEQKYYINQFLLKIGEFSTFLNLDLLNKNNKQNQINKYIGRLQNLPILFKRIEQFEITLFDLSSVKQKIILKQTISKNSLHKFIQQKSIQFQVQF